LQAEREADVTKTNDADFVKFHRRRGNVAHRPQG
jgi:hypothetical protein